MCKTFFFNMKIATRDFRNKVQCEHAVSYDVYSNNSLNIHVAIHFVCLVYCIFHGAALFIFSGQSTRNLTNVPNYLFKSIFPEETPLLMSNKSSAQLHVTFDVGDKHGGICFTYVEIPRNLSIIS